MWPVTQTPTCPERTACDSEAIKPGLCLVGVWGWNVIFPASQEDHRSHLSWVLVGWRKLKLEAAGKKEESFGVCKNGQEGENAVGMWGLGGKLAWGTWWTSAGGSTGKVILSLVTVTPKCVNWNCILGGSEWEHQRVGVREGGDERRGKGLLWACFPVAFSVKRMPHRSLWPVCPEFHPTESKWFTSSVRVGYKLLLVFSSSSEWWQTGKGKEGETER